MSSRAAPVEPVVLGARAGGLDRSAPGPASLPDPGMRSVRGQQQRIRARTDAPRGDFMVETKFAFDLPPDGVFNFHQAGLVLYQDDDRFLKLAHVAIFGRGRPGGPRRRASRSHRPRSATATRSSAHPGCPGARGRSPGCASCGAWIGRAASSGTSATAVSTDGAGCAVGRGRTRWPTRPPAWSRWAAQGIRPNSTTCASTGWPAVAGAASTASDRRTRPGRAVQGRPGDGPVRGREQLPPRR